MTEARIATGARLAGVRALIAKRMRQSLTEAAQISYFVDVDVTEALAHRQELKRSGISVGIEDIVICAVAATVRKYPDFNAVYADGLFTRHEACDISIAISSPGGLVTPVLRGVEELAFEEVVARRRDLVSRALAGKLAVADMKGGSFTISNLGLTRIRHFTPILHHPQVAILGIGQIVDTVRPVAGELVIRKMMGLSLTTDHQVIDGAPCGDFLDDLCGFLESWGGHG